MLFAADLKRFGWILHSSHVHDVQDGSEHINVQNATATVKTRLQSTFFRSAHTVHSVKTTEVQNTEWNLTCENTSYNSTNSC